MSEEKLTLRGENLIKTYGKKKVVKDVSIQVQQGEIIGLFSQWRGKNYDFLHDCGFGETYRRKSVSGQG